MRFSRIRFHLKISGIGSPLSWHTADFQATEPRYYQRMNAIYVPSVYAITPYLTDLGDFAPGMLDSFGTKLEISKALAHAFDLEDGLHDHWGERVPEEDSWMASTGRHLRVRIPLPNRRAQFHNVRRAQG